MKFSVKSIVCGAVLSSVSVVAMAADPIVGTWQTYEDGQPKAQVQITQAGSAFNGKIVAGNTEKAKTFVGKTVLTGVTAKGGGKYSGKAKDPRWGIGLGADISVSGSSMTLSVPIKGSQTWKKIK
ncbi:MULTISPECIES: DUF2147 domain-containing protein [unclassified Moraxella]|uniref:DUF2147 domain-containing protein n=1 Tax=unclassified Moraxella TaxID=2685852 RepID=UPI003AF7797C